MSEDVEQASAWDASKKMRENMCAIPLSFSKSLLLTRAL
jgi:hypothetical protein